MRPRVLQRAHVLSDKRCKWQSLEEGIGRTVTTWFVRHDWMDGSSVRLLGKNNMHCRPQTAGGMTPSPRGNLRAFCSVFCLLFLFSSFSCPHGVFSSQMRNCHIVFFLPFFTSSSSSSPSLSKFTHFLCLPLQSAFSRPSCSLRWCVTPTITTATPLSLGSLPCFLPNSPSLTSPLFIFHIRQSFPWSQLCKQ